MLFSVLIPLYNTEQYIEECIDSVLNQNEKDFEVVIVDDGSTDKSRKIVDAYIKRDSRIRLIHQENKGLFHTRCVLIQEALGDYIVFLDADDKLELDALLKLSVEFKKDDLDMVIYKLSRYENSEIKKETEKTFNHNKIFEGSSKNKLYKKILSGPALNSMSIKAVRRSCFNVNEIIDFPRITMGEDLIHTLRPLTNAKRVKYINEALYIYRIHESSMSHTFNSEVYEKNKFIHNQLNGYLNEWKLDNVDCNNLLSQKLLKETIYLVLFSEANINGNESQYINMIKEIRNDKMFKDTLTENKNLSIRYRVASMILRKWNYRIIILIKLILQRRK